MADRTYAHTTEPKAATSSRGAFFAPAVQAKLTVNQPGDQYEQEADRVADRVVGGHTEIIQVQQPVKPTISRLQRKLDFEAPVQRQTDGAREEEEPVQRQAEGAQEEEEPVQRQAEGAQEEEEPVQRQTEGAPEEEEPVQRQIEGVSEEEEPVQRQAEGAQEDEEPVQRAEKEDEEPVQAKSAEPKPEPPGTETKPLVKEEEERLPIPKPAASVPKSLDNRLKAKVVNTEEESVQARVSTTGTPVPSAGFGSQLHDSKGNGSPLPTPVRTFMESGIGADFGSIRIHTDHQAASMNREINAKAFTHGSDIYFNNGQYNPATNEGKHLLAHELTHTVQQGAAPEIMPKPAGDSTEISSSESPETAVNYHDSDGAGMADDAQDQLKESIPDDLVIEEPVPDIPPDPVETSIDPVEPEISPDDLNLDDPSLSTPTDTPEEVEAVQSVAHSGNSEEMAKAVATASASQMAASYDSLGGTLSTRLNEETQDTAAETPQLHAQNTGAKEQLLGNHIKVSAATDAAIGNGATSANPGALKLPEHQNRGEAPDNTGAKERQIDAKGEDNFFEWVKSKPSNLFGNIQTKDNNVNTSAGPRPTFDKKGDADPERNKNSRKDGDEQGAGAQSENAKEIANNNGQQRIVPVLVDQKHTVVLANKPEPLKTEDSQAAADYVSAPLPADIRAAADAKLAAKLQPKLDKANQDIDAAATTRNTEKKAAVDDHQKQVDELNEQATKEQVETVKSNRKAVADEQKRGVEASATMLRDYHKEADKEQTQADKEVHDRMANDEQQADKELKSGEEKAEAERKRGEVEAAEVKRKKEEEAKDDSWWGSFKRAVKKVVKAITSAIDAVFNAVRKAVKGLIDAAKKAALALIEAGRKWVVDKLNKFRDALKGMVNKLLANFPALRDKVNAFIDKTVDVAIDTVNKAADLLKKGVEALANALGKVLDKILSVFQTALKAAVAIVGAVITGDFAEALRIAIEAACEIAGIDPKPVFDFFDRAGKAIMKILKAPLTFIKNVGKGIGGGFKLFWKNIAENLKAGVIAWLTGAMKETPLRMPETWDIKGIFSVVAQLVGLTLENIKAKFIKAIGPKGAAIWAKVEKTAEFAQKVGKMVTQGPAAIWEFAQDAVGNIKEVVMSAIRNWLTLEVIKQGIIWLLSLTNPASALAKAVKMLFDVAMFLVNRFNQIKDFVLAVYEMISDMVAGNVAKIVTAVENVLKRLIPLLIGLIAAILGLGGLADKVTGIIKKFTMPIERVIMKVVRWLVKKAKSMVKKTKKFVKDKAGKLVEWWKIRKKFKSPDGQVHSLYFTKGSNGYDITVESNPTLLAKIIEKLQNKKVQPFSDVDALRTSYYDLRAVISARNRTKDGQDVAKIDDSIDEKVNTIKLLLSKLGIASDDLPKSNVKFIRSGNKKSVIAKPLSLIPGNTNGSDAQGGVSIPGWDMIKNASVERNWKRGHMLNASLHGPATAENLVPILTEINNNQKQYIEEPAKKAVQQGKIIQYSTFVVLHDSKPGKEYISNFPKSIFMHWAEIQKNGSDWSPKIGGAVGSMSFSQKAPDFETDADNSRAGTTINQSSAGILWEKTKGVISKRVWQHVVRARSLNGNYFGFLLGDFFKKMDAYYDQVNNTSGANLFSSKYQTVIEKLVSSNIIRLNP